MGIVRFAGARLRISVAISFVAALLLVGVTPTAGFALPDVGAVRLGSGTFTGPTITGQWSGGRQTQLIPTLYSNGGTAQLRVKTNDYIFGSWVPSTNFSSAAITSFSSTIVVALNMDNGSDQYLQVSFTILNPSNIQITKITLNWQPGYSYSRWLPNSGQLPATYSLPAPPPPPPTPGANGWGSYVGTPAAVPDRTGYTARPNVVVSSSSSNNSTWGVVDIQIFDPSGSYLTSYNTSFTYNGQTGTFPVTGSDFATPSSNTAATMFTVGYAKPTWQAATSQLPSH